MANKLCNHCGEIKSTEKFGKRTASKDGLQTWCNDCRNISTLKNHKADKNGIVYAISNPDGKVYIGSTHQKFSYRLMKHKASMKVENGKYPLLHNSFNVHGFDNHTFEIIKDYGKKITKNELKSKENWYISKYKRQGISLNKYNAV